MTTFQTLASSSAGNASLFSRGETHLLIDMGISCRRLCQSLAQAGLSPEALDGVVITHEHTDHIGGLATYIKKYRTPILCTPGTARQLAYRLAGVEALLRPLPLGERAQAGEVCLTLLPTSHDCRESAAVCLDTPDGRVGYLTDTGYIPEETGRALLGAELLVLESNHDEQMLLSGPYPYALKRRVLGPQGHLSNADAARYAAASVRAGTRTILLAHLSRENNTPPLALETVEAALEGADCRLCAAPWNTASERFCLEDVGCRG